MSLAARREILRLLKSGSKTREEMQESVLGKVSKDHYKTRYQAFRRAIDDLIQEGVIEDAKYRYKGEGADQKYIQASMQRFVATHDSARHLSLIEDIEAESGKRDAIQTPRLLLFLADRLSDESQGVREIAIRSIWKISKGIDESRKQDRDLLKQLRRECGEKFVDAASNDQSINVRREALKRLIELDEDRTISIIESIIKDSSTAIFKEFKSTLTEYLCQPFEGNRLLKAQKNTLRDVLHELVDAEDAKIAKRAELVLWHLRNGPFGIMPGGEDDIQ